MKEKEAHNVLLNWSTDYSSTVDGQYMTRMTLLAVWSCTCSCKGSYLKEQNMWRSLRFISLSTEFNSMNSV
jgi:hypothetical protein